MKRRTWLLLVAVALVLIAAWVLTQPEQDQPSGAAGDLARVTIESEINASGSAPAQVAATATLRKSASDPALAAPTKMPTPAEADDASDVTSGVGSASSAKATPTRASSSPTPTRAAPSRTPTPARATPTPVRGTTSDLPAGLKVATPAASEKLELIAYDRLPPEAHTTLRLIAKGGPFPYSQDGVVFQNRERVLPQRNDGYYQEYTVETPGAATRGARRIVRGSQDELYYTDDHYASFKRIVP